VEAENLALRIFNLLLGHCRMLGIVTKEGIGLSLQNRRVIQSTNYQPDSTAE
jgi:hypothetical protein